MKGSKAIRSVHVLYSADNKLGGSVHAALHVCRHLKRSGNPVSVLATTGPGDDVGYLSTTFAELSCQLVPRTFPTRYYNAASLGMELDRLVDGAQVVEIHGIWTFATVRAATRCRELRIPYLVRPHGSLDPYDFAKHRLLKRAAWPLFFHRTLTRAASVVFATELESTRAITCGSKVRRAVVPLPVSDIPQGNRQRGRRKFGIPEDAVVVLFFSRVDYGKGLDLLIPILGRLMGQFPKLWFLLAGTGERAVMTETQALLDQHKVAGRTTLAGFVSGGDKSDVLAASDVFVLLSERENFGIVVVEAMQMGLPVVISDQVPLAPSVSRAGAGLVCTPTMDAGYAAVQRLVSDAGLRMRQGANGRRLSRDEYSAEASTQSLLNLYSTVYDSVPAERLVQRPKPVGIPPN